MTCACDMGDRETSERGGPSPAVVQSPTVYLIRSAHTDALAYRPAVEEDREWLARIQCLWVELQAARKDPVKYEAIAERLRREADAFRQMPARCRLLH